MIFMENNELNNLLERMEVPEFQNQTHQRKLRASLMNYKTEPKGFAFFSLMNVSFVLAIALVVIGFKGLKSQGEPVATPPVIMSRESSIFSTDMPASTTPAPALMNNITLPTRAGGTVASPQANQAEDSNAKKMTPPDQKSPVGSQSIVGFTSCLPPKDTSGFHTMECAIGLKADDGSYYALLDPDNSHELFKYSGDQRITVTGMISPPNESLAKRYAVNAEIKVENIESIK